MIPPSLSVLESHVQQVTHLLSPATRHHIERQLRAFRAAASPAITRPIKSYPLMMRPGIPPRPFVSPYFTLTP